MENAGYNIYKLDLFRVSESQETPEKFIEIQVVDINPEQLYV